MERQEIITRLIALAGALAQSDLSSTADDHALAQAIHLLERRQAPASKTRPYSVLLVLPDYLANNYGQETYLAYVEAENAGQASMEAQLDAVNILCGSEEDYELYPDDLYVSLVCEGHIKDLRA